MASSIRNEDLIASARRRTVALPSVTKATDHSTTKAKVLAVFPYPIRIWDIAAYVGNLFATNVIAASVLEYGTLADPDAVAENTAEISATAASGTNIPLTKVTGLTTTGYVLPAGTALVCTNTASAGAGDIDTFLTYEVLDNE